MIGNKYQAGDSLTNKYDMEAHWIRDINHYLNRGDTIFKGYKTYKATTDSTIIGKHGGSGDGSLFRINDIYFSVPPENIGINIAERKINLPNLRTQHTVSIDTNHTEIAAQITLVFTDNPYLGTSMEQEVAYKMMPMLTQITYMPFFEMENEFLRKHVLNKLKEINYTDLGRDDDKLMFTYNGHTIMPDPNTPRATRLTLNVLLFNYLPYADRIKYVKDYKTYHYKNDEELATNDLIFKRGENSYLNRPDSTYDIQESKAFDKFHAPNYRIYDEISQWKKLFKPHNNSITLGYYTYSQESISFTNKDIERDGLSNLFERRGITSPAKALSAEALKGYTNAGDYQDIAFYDETYYKSETEKMRKLLEARKEEFNPTSQYIKQLTQSYSMNNEYSVNTQYNFSGTSSFNNELPKFKMDVMNASIVYGVEESIIKAIIQQESSGGLNMFSGAGARGLMQLMPITADWLKVSVPGWSLVKDQSVRQEDRDAGGGHKKLRAYYGSLPTKGDGRLDNSINVHAGTKYLSEQMAKYNNLPLALAAYNGGPTKLDGTGLDISKMGAETQKYVTDIMKSLGITVEYFDSPIAQTPFNEESSPVIMDEIAFTGMFYRRMYNERVINNIIIDSYEIGGSITIPRIPMTGHRIATHQYMGGRQDTLALKIVSTEEQQAGNTSSVVEFNKILDVVHSNLANYKDLSLMDGVIIKEPFLNALTPGIFFSVDTARIETIPEVPGGEQMVLQATNITKMRTYFYTSNAFKQSERYLDSDIMYKFINEIFGGVILGLKLMSGTKKLGQYLESTDGGQGRYIGTDTIGPIYKFKIISYGKAGWDDEKRTVIDAMLGRLEKTMGQVTDDEGFLKTHGVNSISVNNHNAKIIPADIDIDQVLRSKEIIKIDLRDVLWSAVQENIEMIVANWPSLADYLVPDKLGATPLDFVDQITESAYGDFYLPPTLDPDFYFFQESKYEEYDQKTEEMNNLLKLNDEQYNKALAKYEEQFATTRFADALSGVVVQKQISAGEKESKVTVGRAKDKSEKSSTGLMSSPEVMENINSEQDSVQQMVKTLAGLSDANFLQASNRKAQRAVGIRYDKSLLKNAKAIAVHTKAVYSVVLDDNDSLDFTKPEDETIDVTTLNTPKDKDTSNIINEGSILATIATWNARWGFSGEDKLYAEDILKMNSIVVFNEIYRSNVNDLSKYADEDNTSRNPFLRKHINTISKGSLEERWGTAMYIREKAFKKVEYQPNINYGGNRDAIHCIVTTEGGQKVSVVGLHFPTKDALFNTNDNIGNIKATILNKYDSDYIILLGDFNNTTPNYIHNFRQTIIENTYINNKAETASFDNILIYGDIHTKDRFTNTTSSDHKAISVAVLFGERVAGLNDEDRSDELGKNSLIVEAYNNTVDNGVRDRLTLLNAFPTFKVYVLEDDDEEMFSWMRHDLNEMFGLNAVSEIDFVEHADQPADVFLCRFVDVSRKFTSAKYRDKPKTERKSAATLNTIAENRLTGIVLKPGSRIQFKVGYGNDASQLPTKFNGLIASVEGDGMQYSMECQSYGVEAVYDVKNPNENVDITDFNPGTWEILNWALAQPEMVHFGKWKLMSSANLQMTDGKFGFGFGGALTPDFKRVRADGRVTDRLWVYTRSNTDQNLFTPITEDFGGFVSQLKEHPFRPSDWLDNIFCDFTVQAKTPWEIIDEMTYRYPGYIAKVLPFEDRVTLYYGPPTGLYYNRAFNFRERLLAGSAFFQKRSSALQSLRRGTVRKFQKKWLVSSHKNLCFNKIKADYKDVYTRVVVNYGNSGDSISMKLNQFLKAEEIRTKVLIAPNAPLENAGHEAVIEINGNKERRKSFGGAYDYGTAELWKQSKKFYKGTLGVIINPDIKPYDSIFIIDDRIGMGGSVEVREHVINISQYSGMISSITPSISSHVSASASMTMSDFEDIAISGNEVNQVMNNNGLTQDQINALAKIYEDSKVLQAVGNTGEIVATSAGVGIAATLLVGSISFGALIPFAGAFLLTYVMMISMRTTAFNMAKYTDSIYLRPLLIHGIPYLYGLDTYKMGTLGEFEADQLKMIYDAGHVIKRLSTNYVNTVFGIAKGTPAGPGQ